MDKLRASLRQSKQRVMRKMGKSEPTVDEEFEDLYKRFTQVYKTNKNTIKHLQQLIENFHAMSSTLQFLAEDFRTAYGNGREVDEVDKLSRVAEQVEQDCVVPFQQRVQEDCLDALQSYLVQFEPIEAQTKTRRTLLLDYDYFRDKVRQLAEKSSKDPLALPRAKEKLQQVKDQYDEINEHLKNEMQSIIYNSKSVFDPAFDHILVQVLSFYANTHRTIQPLQGVKTSTIPAEQPPPSFVSSHRHSSDSLGSGTSPRSTTTASSVPSQMYPASAPTGNGGNDDEFDVEWFYLDGLNHQQGPVDFHTLRSLYNSGEVTDTTHVFGGEMDEWKIISEVPGLRPALS